MEQFIVFDIETAPLKWDSLSESQQEYITRYAKDEEEIEKKKFEMGLSPLTAKVVCIGLQIMTKNSEGELEITKRGALSASEEFDDEQEERITLEGDDPCTITSEKKLIQNFWSFLTKFKSASLISFNGRNFDAPFLMLRSAINKIKPSRNIMAGTKFNYPLHIDLIDELTFYNPSPYAATKRFNFDFYTRAFGIKSPKSEGVDGSMVGEMYYNGQYKEIAEYCMRDINATWELYLTWREYLKF